MKIKKIATLLSILLFTATSLVIAEKISDAESPATQNVSAHMSDNFVESIGINTKFGYCPGRLCDNYLKVKTLLGDLGVRYIRDIAYSEPWRTRTDIYKDYGIRMLVGVERLGEEPLNPATIPAQLDVIKSWGEMIMGISGVNEYDNPVYYSCEETENCDPSWSEESWPPTYVEFQKKVYDRVKADPELNSLPVVLGPMARLDNIDEFGNLGAFCDKGNDHSYPGALGKPSQEGGRGPKMSLRSMDEVVYRVQQVCPDKKLWITETGYEESTNGENRNIALVTRKAKAKYLPRIYTNYYLQGQIEKTFLYQLLEPIKTLPTRYGIIDTNLQPTPAYYSIKNMISLLQEAEWNKSRQSWKYPDFKTDSLNYSLEGNTTDIKHILLQKSDGTFYLLIWQEVYVYDNQTGEEIVNRDRIINFKLDGATIEKANKYLLYNQSNPSAELVPLKTWTNVSDLSLNVPDHILVLEFNLDDRPK